MARNASTQRGFEPALVERVLDAIPRRRTPTLVGLTGLQGSGKSTLAAQLVAHARQCGERALALSLDDFYLGRAARRMLARTVHPLLATRGVPGTHDVARLARTLDALASRRMPLALPRFDKGRDARIAPSRERVVRAAPTLVVLEGWCVGVPPQAPHALAAPANALERDDDRDGVWRRGVNGALARDYEPIWSRLDALVWLEPPGFEVVARWRDEQERAQRRRGAAHALSRDGVARFVQHFERLSRHSLRALRPLADVRVVLDDARAVRRVVVRSQLQSGASGRPPKSPLVIA